MHRFVGLDALADTDRLGARGECSQLLDRGVPWPMETSTRPDPLADTQGRQVRG